MKRMFFSIFIILIPGFITARCTNNLVFAETKAGQGDSVTSLNRVRESYKLSGKNLTALAKKILYKKTPQEDMYLYLLRPAGKTKKALPAIVYFTRRGLGERKCGRTNSKCRMVSRSGNYRN